MKPPNNRKRSRLLLKPALFGGLLFAVTALAQAQQPGTATPAQALDSRQIDVKVETLLKQLTLEEKVKYLVGNPPADPTLPNSTSQDIPPVPRLGLPELRNFDGPVGVRPGTAPSTRFPANLLLAATWNPERAFDQARGIARDGRARGFAVWYGPAMNMYRVPVGGRNSEYLCGEDPLLGSRLAVAQVFGAQAEGIVATAKHFVTNDQEYKRFVINNVVDERTLREIYFPPFEAAVRQGHAGSVMLAYNKLNGVFCAQDPFLMRTVLEAEWGFKGFPVSDYGAVHDPVAAIQAGLGIIYGGLSLQSPAPLLQAVQSGQLPLEVVDDAVRRILRVIVAFNFQNRSAFDPSIPLDDPFSTQAGLDTAHEGITLLKNEGNLLPFRRGRTHSIAVVGRYAGGDPPQQGGSGMAVPVHFTSELQGLQQVANGATRVNVDYLRAGNLDFGVAEFRVLGANGQYQPGLKAEYFNNQDLSGSPVLTRQEAHLSHNYPADAPSQVGSSFSARWSGEFVAPVTGDYAVKFQAAGNARLYLGGQKIYDDWTQTEDPTDLENLRFYPTIVTREVHLQAGQPLTVSLEYKFPGGLSYHIRPIGVQHVGLGWAPLEAPADLGTYDAVVIAAGFDQNYEGEGADRAAVVVYQPGSFEMPEYQDDLIQKMAAANPHTVVVLHGGGSMDIQRWIGQVQGLVHAVFPGQDGGRALAEILFGEVNPSGKLPFTFEKRFQDNPAYPNYPATDATGTTAVYKEGIFMGYRGFDIDKNGVQPQYPFGYGLSYTTFAYSDLDIEPERDGHDRKQDGHSKTEFREHHGDGDALAKVSFTVTNTGNRAGAEVAELYVGQQNPRVPRPIKELKGFEKVFLQPGDSRRITLELDQHSFAYFNTATEQWDALPDTYNILVGASSQDLRLQGQFELQSELTSKP